MNFLRKNDILFVRKSSFIMINEKEFVKFMKSNTFLIHELFLLVSLVSMRTVSKKNFLINL